jgi:hypothetical protein
MPLSKNRTLVERQEKKTPIPDISPDFVASGGRVRFFRVFTVRAGRRCVETQQGRIGAERP